MREEILCRVTVGLANPYTGQPQKAGSFVLVSRDDEKFGPLIGKYLVPCDSNGDDLPEDQWAGPAAEPVLLPVLEVEDDDEPESGPNADEEPPLAPDDEVLGDDADADAAVSSWQPLSDVSAASEG